MNIGVLQLDELKRRLFSTVARQRDAGENVAHLLADDAGIKQSLSAEQFLLTTLIFKVAVVAILATMLARFQFFRRILLTERRDWPERLTFAVALGLPLAAGVLSRLLLNFSAAVPPPEGTRREGDVYLKLLGRKGLFNASIIRQEMGDIFTSVALPSDSAEEPAFEFVEL